MVAKNLNNQEIIFITPRAKKLVEENGYQIADIIGSGPDGLIIERDVVDFEISMTAREGKMFRSLGKL